MYGFWQGRITEIERELKEHLQEQRKRLGCSELNYWGAAKDRFQIEVPERHLAKKPQVVLYLTCTWYETIVPFYSSISFIVNVSDGSGVICL